MGKLWRLLLFPFGGWLLIGYYLITKELEKVKFAKLVKEIDDVEEELRAWEKIAKACVE